MKTKTWIFLFVLLALVCLALSIVFLSAPANDCAKVYTEGKLILEIDLNKNGEYRVGNGENWNILVVNDGKISVRAASCPTQDCVKFGERNSGAPIVCLPNRMVIEFADTEELDALAG